MGRINSKAKGSKNERDVCEYLEQWSGLQFRRVPQSGGLRGHITDYTVGDIICVDKRMLNRVFPYSIECKSYNTIDFAKLLSIPRKPTKKSPEEHVACEIDKFWAQAVEDGKRGQKLPMLIMRYNNLPKNFFFIVLSRKLTNKKMLPKNRMVTQDYVITTSASLLEDTTWDSFFKQSLKIWKSLYG